MVCPKCGAEIKEGCVYCEKCGGSIQFVPNFEPEIEERIDETLSALVEDVLTPEEDTLEMVSENVADSKESKKKLAKIIITSIITIAFLISVIVIYQSTKYSTYFNRGVTYAKEGKFEKAIAEFEKAIKRDPDKKEARMEEANAYRMLGNNDAALRRLYEVIDMDESDTDAYNSIISIYEEKGDYTNINKLLVNCKNTAIYESHKGFIALPPKFSEEEGTYQHTIDLKLMTDNEGTIFYTLDGSEPTKDSIPYTEPIELGKGKNIVRAIFVNEKGIISDSISKIFEIDVLKPDAPIITPSSGGFISPEDIIITAPEDCEVFYTTDGTTPTENSKKYTGRIPMPIGDSHFKFIARSNDGLMSDVINADYVLTFIGQCTNEEAANFVIASLTATGKLLSVDGSLPEKEGKNTYLCNSASDMHGRICYMIQEFYDDGKGNKTETGNYYAVDAYNCNLYRVVRDSEDNFLFENF